MPIRKTIHQKEVIRYILSGALRGAWYDVDELMDEFVASSKQGMQCSLRILEKSGYISKTYERRRRKRRMVPVPTKQAFDEFGL